MARRVRGPRFVRKPGTKVWIGAGFAEGAVSMGNNFLSTFNAAALALRPFTILRTRLIINFQSDQVAASETTQGAFGKMVVSDQASGVGAIAIPGPVTNSDAPWYVYEPLISSLVFATAAAFIESAGITVSVDSKAMRKVGANETVVTMLELRAAEGAFVLIEGRTLVEMS